MRWTVRWLVIFFLAAGVEQVSAQRPVWATFAVGQDWALDEIRRVAGISFKDSHCTQGADKDIQFCRHDGTFRGLQFTLRLGIVGGVSLSSVGFRWSGPRAEAEKANVPIAALISIATEATGLPREKREEIARYVSAGLSGSLLPVEPAGVRIWTSRAERQQEFYIDAR